jgi:hypothetical protein
VLAAPRPTSHDEIEALLGEVRVRQLRRRLLGAAAIAILAAIGLSVYALTLSDGDQVPSGGSASAGAPLCRSGQLSAAGQFNGATGSVYGAVMIFDTTGRGCSLPAVRPIVHIAASGRPLPVQQSASKLSPALAPPLRHGAMAEVFVQWSNWCGGAPTAMTLRFGHGLEVTAPLVDTRPPCRNPPSESAIAVSRLLTRH